MDELTLLSSCRDLVREIMTLEDTLRVQTGDGRPSGVRAACYDHLPGSNMRAAAENDYISWLEQQLHRAREQLEQLSLPVNDVLDRVTDCRLRSFCRLYYRQGLDMEQVAELMHFSVSYVYRLSGQLKKLLSGAQKNSPTVRSGCFYARGWDQSSVSSSTLTRT